MNSIDIREKVLEILEQLRIQKAALSSADAIAAVESDPDQVDLFTENKLDALNYCQNLIVEKFAEFIPEKSSEIQSKEYDIFKNGMNDCIAEVTLMIDDLKHKRTDSGSHPSIFEKGVIEGLKRSLMVFKRKLHHLQ